MRTRWTGSIAGAAVAACTVVGAAAAQRAPLIPLEHFFDNPEVAGAQISPDGQWLSYLKPYRGKLNIHVRPVGGGAERLMTTDTTRPVMGYFWSADASRLLYVQDKGGNENYHIYSVPVAGTGTPEARDLTPFENVRALIFAVPRELPGRILIGLNRRDPTVFDAFWLDLETGELTLAAQNPGRHVGYMVDTQNRVRLALSQDERGGTVIHVRDTESDPWRTVATYPVTESVGPLRFHPDGQRVYLSSNHGDTDLARLVLRDLATGREEPIEGDPENQVDFSGAWFSEIDHRLLATYYNADTVRVYAKTPEVQRHMERIRAVHGGTPQITSMTRDEKRWIVSFDSPTDPGATYLYDTESGKAEFLFRPRPWLEPTQLAEMQPISYRARDGLTIHGYLSLPRGVEPRRLPLVLLVHGGPWARDTWGYDAEAQLLANRGYAVLQVNYRGSTGYGKRFYNAAVKEWAGAMHTDLIDGVQWAVAQGIADPERVAIYGGSYGGYATLVGLTMTPEVFACGVDYVGPSSLITLIESFPPYWRPMLESSFYRHVGDPSKPEDREDMKKRSPLYMVDRIEDPLLIVQGANDPRVTKREADQLAIALRDRGVPVRYLLAENEGHGFANPDNRLAFYREMERFLGECLGGRVQPRVAAEVESHITGLLVDVASLELPPEVQYAEVQVGDAAVDGGLLAAGSAARRIVLVRAGQEQEIGTATDVVELVEHEGRPALRRIQTLNSPMLGTQADTLVLLRETLAPLLHRSVNTRRTMQLDYHGTHVSGAVVPAGGAAQPVDAMLDTPVFDSNAIELILRSLPLAANYAVRVPVYLHEAGGKTVMEARVTGSEAVGGTDAWIVEATIAGQKVHYWIAKQDRTLLRQALQAAPGVEIRFVP